MFSRRHPFLFFTITFAAVIMTGLLAISVMIAIISGKTGGYEYPFGSEGKKIGIIEVSGIITKSKDVIYKLKRFREDDSIKGIVLRIDSPGGGVGPSQEIHREIEKTTKKKKVIASMGSIATSGGYYIAAPADGIIANPGTITGSIGVIMGFTNYEELLNKIGLKPVVIKSGEYKDIGSPVRSMKDSEKKILQTFSDSIHRQFIQAVSRGRKIETDTVRAFSDGRIFSGEKALELGLVDRLGNLEDAIRWAGEMSGIKGKIAPAYQPDKEDSFIKQFLKTSFEEITSRAAESARPSAGYLYAPASD